MRRGGKECGVVAEAAPASFKADAACALRFADFAHFVREHGYKAGCCCDDESECVWRAAGDHCVREVFGGGGLEVDEEGGDEEDEAEAALTCDCRIECPEHDES